MHRVVKALLLSGLLFLVFAAGAASPARAQQTDLDRQVREIALGLRCPVCQNLSVADSPSALALEMRAIIRRKLQAGETSQAIVQYFVASYGEGILLDPPRQGFTLLVWLGALASVVGGLALLTVRLRRALSGRAVQGEQAAVALPVAHLAEAERQRYEARLDAELAGRGQGGV